MTVNRERMELWAQALESDGYQQCAYGLRLTLKHGEIMHCAEGVAMAVAEAYGVQIDLGEWDSPSMPPQVYQWYGITYPVVVEVDDHEAHMTVIAANDQARMSFWDIAQALRARYIKEEK